MAKSKKAGKAKDAKSSDSSRLYIAAAAFAAVLAVGCGAFAGGIIDSTAQPRKAPTMERPPPVERAAAKSKTASKQPADTERDKNPSCASWAAAGECKNNPPFMASNCATSCRGQLPEQSELPSTAEAQLAQGAQQGLERSELPDDLATLWPAPQLTAELERAQAESDARGVRPSSDCVDLRDDCASLARHNLSGCGEAPVMCTACALHVHRMCMACARHVHGMCTAQAPVMLTDCRKTCRLCRHLKVAEAVRTPTLTRTRSG